MKEAKAEKADKVEITKLKIKMAHNEVEISIEDARKLKAALDELFGKEVIKEVHKCDHWHWYWNTPHYYYSPYVYTTPVPAKTYDNPVTWGEVPVVTSGYVVTNGTSNPGEYSLTVTV